LSGSGYSNITQHQTQMLVQFTARSVALVILWVVVFVPIDQAFSTH